MRRFRLTLLVIVASLAALAFATASPGLPAHAAGACTPGADFRPSNAALAGEVIALVNRHRATLGLRALTVSPSLTASAVWKARHMATYGYMGHDDPAPPVARSAAARIVACGYSSTGWGENVAAGFTTAASVLAAWLQSPGHRANIENPAFVTTGAGASATASGAVLWAQDFGQVADAGGTAPSAPAPPSAPARRAAPIVLQDLRVAHRTARVVARVRAVVAPTMAALRNGSTGCAAAIAGRPLRVVGHTFRHGIATCVWRIAGRRGLVRASVTVRSGRRSAHAPFAFVRR